MLVEGIAGGWGNNSGKALVTQAQGLGFALKGRVKSWAQQCAPVLHLYSQLWEEGTSRSEKEIKVESDWGRHLMKTSGPHVLEYTRSF